MTDDATIAAVASPAGTGGIGIIKISGPDALRIAASIFRPSQRKATPALDSHRLTYGHVVDPDSGHPLDEVLISFMKAPRSYTREDVVEINTHGGGLPTRAILELVLRQGARLAEPGEFTRRAFVNGRIDLTQAEAVIDLINSRSAQGLESAAALLAGALRQEIEAVRSACLELRVRLEADIDFPEDVDEAIDPGALNHALQTQVTAPLQKLVRHYFEGRVIREGLKVAIVGRPNVGKSSLMNRLLGRERAIVTEHPGTTRDAIEDCLVLRGIPVSLWDTAGLHDGRDCIDPVEAIGMHKTIEHSAGADLVLFVLEAHRPVSAADREIFERICPKPVVVVLNKTDLITGGAPPAVLPGDWSNAPHVAVSALTGHGLDMLTATLVRSASAENPIDSMETVIPNLRQKTIIERCLHSAGQAAAELERTGAPELVVVHLAETLNGLDEILGTSARVDVLESIFSRFCIGK